MPVLAELDATGSLRTIIAPRGMYSMPGDNRGASDDSRFWGAA